MKILLTLPPIENPIGANFVDTFDNESGQYPPIGLLYIAAYARKYSKHIISILDPQAQKLSHDDTLLEILKNKPGVLGVHVLTFHLLDCLKLIENVKKAMPDITIVCGGPHVHIYPKETLSQKGVDFVMIGECEQSFTDFLCYLEGSKKVNQVDGLYYYSDKQRSVIGMTTTKSIVEDINTLPHPARDMIDIDLYSSVLAKYSIATTIMTSRGCPFSCTYCDRPALGKTFRARSPKNVIEELKQCVNMGINEFNIFDDTFTIDRRRVVEICKLIIAENLNIRWACRSRVHLVNSEILEWMKKAGCGRISFGVETASDRIGKIIKKGATNSQAVVAIKLTKDAGIEVLADFILGSPTETPEEIEETIRFAITNKPDFAQFSIMTPYPATELYRQGLQQGLYVNDHWEDFAKNPTVDWVPPIWHEIMTREELLIKVKDAYFRFYYRPYYLLSQLISLNSFGEFKRKARAGLKVLKTRFSSS